MRERLYALSYALRTCMAIIWIARAVYTEDITPELGCTDFHVRISGGALPRGQNIKVALHAQLRALGVRTTALGFGPNGADQRRIDPGPRGGTPLRPAPRAVCPYPLCTPSRPAPRPVHPAPRTARGTPPAPAWADDEEEFDDS